MTKKKQIEQEDLDNIEQLRKLTDSLTPEQRERMSSLGIVVPEGDIASALEGRYKFGVRCTHCNKVALYFVGDQWTLENGEVVHEPPPLPHTKIAWTQDLPASQINRHDPTCQHCGVQVPTEGAGQFRRNRGRIVQIDLWTESRDKAFDRKALAAFKKHVNSGGGSVVDLPASYDQKGQRSSEVLDSDRPLAVFDHASDPNFQLPAGRGEGTTKELEFLADVTGITEGLTKKPT